MEETGTRIAVSPVSEVSSFNPERTISIAAPPGEVDAVSRAEAEVSARLRAAYESDVHNNMASVRKGELLILHIMCSLCIREVCTTFTVRPCSLRT